ncbi:MAG: 23S rRNA (guanosine(2251)-2'-O)-methyltransferase RlmB [Burkholderiaceae bacterium]|nr:23S rRNA (guanosine(2251)-2'-O)-methyltransferase RlmB [Burkholderiaceae bacterium]
MSADPKEICLLGFHAVRARLRSAPETISRIVFDGQRRDARLNGLLKLAEQVSVKTVADSATAMERLAKGQRHQGVLAIAARRPQPDSLSDLLEQMEVLKPVDQWLLVLDGVTDPHNLGAILRSADAAGAAAVIAPRDKSAPLNDVAARVSAGAADHLPYLQVTNLARAIEELQQADYQVIGLAGESEQSLYAADLKGRIALVLGAEGEGMRRLTRERCDILVRLPMMGSVESLNVSVAAGVCCYEALRQRSQRSK